MSRDDFSKYVDSEKAIRVWLDYRGELANRGLLQRAEEIARTCTISEDLDLRLDRLLTDSEEFRMPAVPVTFKLHQDIDADGCWSNARRALEEIE